jgi:hypothetical protein
MIKISLSITFVILSSISNAQITKRNWMVGGSGTFSKQEQESIAGKIKSSRLILTPNIGYFFVDKFAAGIKPSLDFYKNTVNARDDKNTQVGIGPFVRYYFLPVDKIVNLFAEADYRYSSGSNGYRQNLYFFSAGPVVYFNTSVGLEFTLNYEIVKRGDAAISAKTIFLGIGLQIHLEKEDNEQ